MTRPAEPGGRTAAVPAEVLRLGLGEQLRPWLAGLAATGAPARPPRLPTGPAAAELLARLGVDPADAAAVLDTLPGPQTAPGRWWLLERCYAQLVGVLGDPDAPVGWPSLPLSLGAAGRCFYAHVFLAAVEDVRDYHRRRGVPDAVSWATLADLGRHMSIYRQVTGTVGLDRQHWLSAHFRGELYELGRLQFARYRLKTGPHGPQPWYDDAAAERLGFRPGDPALGVHIPAAGPLTPAECDRSLRWAREFAERHLPGPRPRLATCSSWLLDDQLAEYLPADSNMVRFQRRFTLVPDTLHGDDEVVFFVFRRELPGLADLAELPQRTTLQRAIVTHLRAGRQWRIRTGWVRL